MRAVRALNRQRIMEIKAERLANGSIMATDCTGQLGKASEEAIAAGERESMCTDKDLGGDSAISVMLLHRQTCPCAHTQTHSRRHTDTERGPEASTQE